MLIRFDGYGSGTYLGLKLQICNQLQKENDEVIEALDRLRLLYVERPAELNRQRGRSLIDYLIAIVLAFCVFSIVVKVKYSNKAVCVGGYVHTVDVNASLRQILDDQGHGIKCDG